jgi:hypothetical protein
VTAGVAVLTVVEQMVPAVILWILSHAIRAAPIWRAVSSV